MTTSDMDALRKLSEGLQQFDTREFEGAIARFDEVIALRPSPQALRNAYFKRLDALRELGRHDQAKTDEANWESVEQGEPPPPPKADEQPEADAETTTPEES